MAEPTDFGAWAQTVHRMQHRITGDAAEYEETIAALQDHGAPARILDYARSIRAAKHHPPR